MDSWEEFGGGLGWFVKVDYQGRSGFDGGFLVFTWFQS